MKILSAALLLVASSALVAFASTQPAPVPVSSAPAKSLTVDAVHSNVLFKVMHNKASWFYGRFADIQGAIQFDEADGSKCSVTMTVKAESVDTRNSKLDQHLRSPDFFDAVQFPTIEFKSSKVEQIDEHKYEVTGDLSLHGVTKSITFEMEHTGTGQGRGGDVMGFHATFMIDRSEYGMNYGVGGPLGKDVELIVSLEANEG